ncbi:MAG: tyrosine-type recombinase/integrase [Syntrophobacteraceae bacterium]|nr:tyrosine-type recombinase/integrase [Desulfobacteraceae bacterium]
MATILSFNRVDDKQERGSGSISRKAGSNKLYLDFYYFGKRIEKSTGLDDTLENRQKARIWLDRQLAKIADGTFRFAEAFPGASEADKRFFTEKEGWHYSPDARQSLFEDYFKKWESEIFCGYTSEGKKRDYQQAIYDRLLPYFGKKTFYQITGVELKKFIASLKWREGKKKGEVLSRSRIGNILAPLRTIWSDACEENHWDLPDPFRFVAKHLPEGSNKHPDVLRFDEWKRILECIDPFFRPISEIMVMTGMIGSEIAGLRKGDIQKDHILIRNSIVRKVEKRTLKTKYRDRRLPITDSLRALLETVLSRTKSEYVFSMKSGRIFDVDSFRKNPWTTALKKAGINYGVPYTTRHTFAAWALTIGMNPNKLVKRMGHGSKKMVYEVYGNYVEGLEQDADKILEYFGNDFINL